MNKLITIILLASLAFLAGCNKQTIGSTTGAIVGGYVGSTIGGGSGRLVATAAGTLAGAMLGSSVGASMDELDQMKANRTFEHARTGSTSRWQNPDSGVQYAVTPTHTYETAAGPCREYRTNATIDGRVETVYGTACRQNDGRWQTVN